jgi:hypothetical protein
LQANLRAGALACSVPACLIENDFPAGSRPTPTHDPHAASTRIMTSLPDKAVAFLRSFAVLLGVHRDSGPVDSIAAFDNFVATRSAYIAQKTLYGYVKTRMGTRYPAMFEDAKIIASLNIAKVNVFAACLSDLTVYATAVALAGCPVDNNARADLARRCYAAGLHANTGDAPPEFSPQECTAEFDRRLADTDWHRTGTPEDFTRSPLALVKWAPIADNLKKYDTEIVENSIRFAWRSVRDELRRRTDADAVCAELARQPAG